MQKLKDGLLQALKRMAKDKSKTHDEMFEDLAEIIARIKHQCFVKVITNLNVLISAHTESLNAKKMLSRPSRCRPVAATTK